MRWHRHAGMARVLMREFSRDRISVSDVLLPAGIDSWQRTRWYEDARQPVVQGRSLSGFRTAQMCLIRSPATSNATTATVTPPC
jgi:hypothetical protein